ncbi:MAG TPA: cob(I)yrinic acid a,c-diamide adenosyltransferase [Candidatus Paceibacterota bacterium]|nr:cob(I)yrinic acid a,c-diamide adenosyltransferase [Candidatus Paceibacterota bacterium]HMP18950.1 cob(I)yrinic acid a,c-diamide adenosyltransferase [Candidatus Paceibacterota bacterium]HMP85443.1 cob(I)yrinic acid a,c-diamide adenosyltransferase [Candidatus Paceibacterota bacterium]
MSLFTGKGDDGTTYAFGSNKRFSKSSDLAEALGTVDELNSYLGFLKISSRKANFFVKIDSEEFYFEKIIEQVQQNLFIIQAQIAGADKNISENKISQMSDLINKIEKEMPPIKTFFVSGGVELSTLFDFARTVCRRAERRVVSLNDSGEIIIEKNTLAYLNRLSSLLYAMARLSNHLSGIKEEIPNYQ